VYKSLFILFLRSVLLNYYRIFLFLFFLFFFLFFFVFFSPFVSFFFSLSVFANEVLCRHLSGRERETERERERDLFLAGRDTRQRVSLMSFRFLATREDEMTCCVSILVALVSGL